MYEGEEGWGDEGGGGEEGSKRKRRGRKLDNIEVMHLMSMGRGREEREG